MNILIVDDETPIREWIQFCIERAAVPGLQVAGSARNGREAYAIFCDKHPEVVISDIKMPVMDGISLLKKVYEHQPDTVFLILTNHAEFAYAQEAVAYGARKYLLKSELRGEELLRELESISKELEQKNAALAQHQRKGMTEGARAKDSQEETLLEPLLARPAQDCSQVIQDALGYIEDHYREEISLVDVAKHVYRSSEYLSRLFKAETGENFSIYLMMYRLRRARELLQATDMKIYQVAYDVGYGTPGYFTRIYRKYMGESPEDTRSQYRRRMSK